MLLITPVPSHTAEELTLWEKTPVRLGPPQASSRDFPAYAEVVPPSAPITFTDAHLLRPLMHSISSIYTGRASTVGNPRRQSEAVIARLAFLKKHDRPANLSP